MYGPCADYKNPTRNGNFYSRKLWENVFNRDIIKESLRDRILIGELDHPDSRLESKAVNSCIVMTDYEFHDDEGLLYGKFDILPTPNGRILKSLLDCNCKVGISSRGEGDVVERVINGTEEVNQVDEDSYEFVAFDAVILPAVKAAKPELQESINRLSLSESFHKEINSATTVSELELIKDVVEAINLPDTDSLLESVNNKSQELTRGVTNPSILHEDLEKATATIQELTEKVTLLNEELTTSKSKYQKQLQESIKEADSLKEVNTSLSKDNELLKSNNTSLQESYNALIFESSMQLKDLRSSLEVAKSKVNHLEKELEASTRTNKVHTMSLEESNQNLRESISKIKASESENLRLIEELKGTQERITKELQESSKSNQQLSNKLLETKKAYETTKRKLLKTESAMTELRAQYITEQCRYLQIDSDKVLSKVKPNSTLKEVDKVIKENLDRENRYRSLSFAEDKLIEILNEGVLRYNDGSLQDSQERNQTNKFMEEASKLY